jgi:hypothetical protein
MNQHRPRNEEGDQDREAPWRLIGKTGDSDQIAAEAIRELA